MEFVDKPTDTSASRGISAIDEILVIVRVSNNFLSLAIVQGGPN